MRRCLNKEAVRGAVTATGALLRDQGPDMRLVLDLLTFVVAARVIGEDLPGVGDADLAGVGEHRQRSPHMGVRNRIVVEVEADIGRFAGAGWRLSLAKNRRHPAPP